jgi:hypothetical protein
MVRTASYPVVPPPGQTAVQVSRNPRNTSGFPATVFVDKVT